MGAKKILVLCSGNASRSQMAEGYLNYYASEVAEFYSAGIVAKGLHPFAVQVMAEDNIDISANSSKTYREFSGIHFDYLLTVCDEAREAVTEISASRHFHFSIPDPDSGDPSARHRAFLEVREQVKKHMLRFIGRELQPSFEPVVK